MWLRSACLFLLILAITVADVKGACSNMENRYLACLEEYITRLSAPSFTADDCSAATTRTTDCIDQIITSCNDDTEWSHVATLLNVTRMSEALASACQNHTDIKTTYSCYKQQKTELQECILEEQKRLLDIWSAVTGEQRFCLSIDAFGTCSKKLVQSNCNSGSVSDNFLYMIEGYLPDDCYGITKPSVYNCSDADVMSKYAGCMNEFLTNVSALTFEIEIKKKEQKCFEAQIKTLQCAQTLLQTCAVNQRWGYIQKLLNFNRTRVALAYACAHTWDMAAGTFCQNKHLVSDIQPCIDRKVGAKQNQEQSQSNDAEEDTSDEKPLWAKVCSDIDDRISCIRDGMAESCNSTGIAYTDYLSMFFPGKCFKEDDDVSKSTTMASVSAIITVLLLTFYVLI